MKIKQVPHSTGLSAYLPTSSRYIGCKENAHDCSLSSAAVVHWVG